MCFTILNIERCLKQLSQTRLLYVVTMLEKTRLFMKILNSFLAKIYIEIEMEGAI